MSRRISAYQVALYVGCVAGTYAGAAVAADDHLSVSRFVVATVLLIAVAVAGSRGWHLWLVRANSAEDASRPGKGMALFGGLALSLLVSFPLLVAVDLNVLRFWDATSVTMLVGLAITRVGCSINGCCCGRPTESRWGVAMRDSAGITVRRIPTQPIEIAWALVALAVVLGAQTWRARPGTTGGVVVAAYVLLRLATQDWRESGSDFARSQRCLMTVVGLCGLVAAVTAA